MEKKRRGRALPAATAMLAALLGAGLLTNAGAVAEGVRRGLEVCGGVLIPSLFPFLVLSIFLSQTDSARILSLPLTPLTTRVFKLPGELGAVVLLSMVGGYPVGARMIGGLLEQRRIDSATAQRMLCFCVNCGPSFLISAVGTGLLLDRRAGVILFATQTAATLVIGWLVSMGTPRPAPTGKAPPALKGSAALVAAVQGATASMLTMCAFAILFSGLLSMAISGGVAAALAKLFPVGEEVAGAALSGLFEITSGSVAAAKLGGTLSFGMLSAMASFGGLSVLFQIMSCFDRGSVSFRPMVLSRLCHGVLATLMALPLYRAFCRADMVWVPVRPPMMQVDGKTTLLSVCLLGMCTIFLLSAGESLRRKK